MPADLGSSIPALDTLGMFQAALNSGQHFLSGSAAASGATSKLDTGKIQNIVVAGMGGSAIAGDFAAAALKSELEVPLLVSRSYKLPAFTRESSLVLAISFSGGTLETLSALDDALAKGAQIAVICTGGDLESKAVSHSLPLIKIDGTIPMPRAALAMIFSALLTILGEAGFASFERKDLEATAAYLEKRAGELSGKKSPARKLAENLLGTLPIVKGAEGIAAAAAKRWKAQINENVKTPAFASEVPEAFHNELSGWGLHGDITRQVFSQVQLRSSYESPELEKAYSVAGEMEREVMRECFEVEAKGSTALEQLLDMALFGDFTSLFMADLAGVDPGPIPAIQDFKRLTG